MTGLSHRAGRRVWHSIEVQWDQPDLAAFLERLASFGRLICFDQRGSGVSDPVSLAEVTSLDLWMDDIRAVMDEVRSQSAVLYGVGGGGTMSMLFAATHPDRVSGLVLINSFARIARAPDTRGEGAGSEEVLDVMRSGWAVGYFSSVAPAASGGVPAWWRVTACRRAPRSSRAVLPIAFAGCGSAPAPFSGALARRAVLAGTPRPYVGYPASTSPSRARAVLRTVRHRTAGPPAAPAAGSGSL